MTFVFAILQLYYSYILQLYYSYITVILQLYYSYITVILQLYYSYITGYFTVTLKKALYSHLLCEKP